MYTTYMLLKSSAGHTLSAALITWKICYFSVYKVDMGPDILHHFITFGALFFYSHVDPIVVILDMSSGLKKLLALWTLIVSNFVMNYLCVLL